MPTAVTPTKTAAEAEAKVITEAAEVRQIHDINISSTFKTLNVRQIHDVDIPSTFTTSKVRPILDVDIPYIRQKHLWCRSAPPIDVQGAFIGSPVTFRWVHTNANTQVFTIIDVQGALTGSPVTSRWVRTNADAYSLALKPSHGQSKTPHGQPQPQRGRGACHHRLCLRWQTLVRHRRHRRRCQHCQLRLRRGHRQTLVRHRQHPQYWHRQPHRRCNSNLITDAWTVNAVWVTALPKYRESTPLHEFRQRRMGRLIAGRRTTSSQTLALSSSSPTLPTPTLPASLAGIGFIMTEALPSISWRPAPPPLPEAAHLDLQASLTLPTLSALPTKSAIPNQGLPTSAPLMPYGRPFCQHRHRHRRRDKIIAGTQKNPWPTSAPSMPYGQPFHPHLRHHRRRDNHIAGKRKTSSPTSAPSMPYSRPFRQHLHCHRRRDKLIASTRKTSSPTSAPSMLYGRSICQHLHRQLSSTHQSMLRGQYHRWRQRLGPHRRQKPNNFVHGPNLKTLAKLATVLVGECVNTIALSLITGTSALSLITSYTGPFLRRLPSSQPSWWGNVLIPGSFPIDHSPVSSGPLAHYK
jgi:hypothetical protein